MTGLRGFVSVGRIPYRSVRALLGSCGSVLLRSGAFRRAANEACERFGDRVGSTFVSIFDNPPGGTEFLWRCRFGQHAFVMPVLPYERRSWNAALAWRWRGNRAVRLFYEWYLRERPFGVLVDIGANDGTHTYPFAVHGYRCICFEPQPSCVRYIQRVCRDNGFQNVTIEEVAVSDTEGESEFFVSASTWFSSLVHENVARLEHARPMAVTTVSLDAFCHARDVRPTLLKIDVEGAEDRVFAGSVETLRDHRPDLFVEVWNDKTTRERLWTSLAGLDYRCYRVDHSVRQPFQAITHAGRFIDASPSAANADFIFLGPTWDAVHAGALTALGASRSI